MLRRTALRVRRHGAESPREVLPGRERRYRAERPGASGRHVPAGQPYRASRSRIVAR